MVGATLHLKLGRLLLLSSAESLAVFSLQCGGMRVREAVQKWSITSPRQGGHCRALTAPGCQQHVEAWALMIRAWEALWRAAPSRRCRNCVGFCLFPLWQWQAKFCNWLCRLMLIESNENWVCGDRERQKGVNISVPQSLITSHSCAA